MTICRRAIAAAIIAFIATVAVGYFFVGMAATGPFIILWGWWNLGILVAATAISIAVYLIHWLNLTRQAFRAKYHLDD